MPTKEALIIESLFNVVSKEGEDVPFILNDAQRAIDENLTGRDIIPKARQEGVSTYFLARYTAACMMYRNVSAVIISHEGEATQRLLQRCQYFLHNLRVDQKPEIGRDSINIITFPKMNSRIYIGTAGSKKFGRGDTISHLHCSEYAYWPDPKSLLSGLLQSVPKNGEIAIESTGKGKGNDYHRRCMRAYSGQSFWKCHFLPWHTFREYTFDLSPDEEKRVLSNLIRDDDPELDELNLMQTFNLTPGQLVWRRMKLEEMDYDVHQFQQEYPFTIDQCFQASGVSLFHKVNFQPTENWKHHGNNLYVLEGHPARNRTYVMGVDPSGGSGNDNAVIHIADALTGEQVAEYAYNRIEPDALGAKAAALGKTFNNAYAVVESNNHGPVTLGAMRSALYPEHLLYSMQTAGQSFEDTTLMKLGLRTTTRTKPIMIGKLRTNLSQGCIIHSPELRDELSTFIEHENGSLAADDNCMDDRVMAQACAHMGIERALMYANFQHTRTRRVQKDPFNLDTIIEDLDRKRNDFPIKSGLAAADAFKF